MREETPIWELYRRGRDYFNRLGMEHTLSENRRFYEGDQWYGLESGGERLPVFNVIAPVVNYKVAMVAQKRLRLSFTPFGESTPKEERICKALGNLVARGWERLCLDKKQWDILKEACIGGTAFTYFYRGEKGVEMNLLDHLSVMLANEQETDIQSQPYLLILQRLPVDEVKAIARKNRLPQDKIDLIVPDETFSPEVQTDGGKCLSVLKLWKEKGEVHFARATRFVTYQPDCCVRGLTRYPVAKLCWQESRGNARGISEVHPLVPNQIEINKSMARTAVMLKNAAYPRLAYQAGVLSNPSDLDKVGAPIEVMGGSVADLSAVVKYLQPQGVSAQVLTFTQDMMSKTAELSGVGNAVTGAVNPENASGAAILAARDAAALNLSGPCDSFFAFAEEVARILVSLWCAYHPEGIPTEKGKHLSPAELLSLECALRVDVTRCDAFSKLAGEESLNLLLEKGHITFAEYVSSLDDDGTVPKARLLRVLAERGENCGRDASETAN